MNYAAVTTTGAVGFPVFSTSSTNRPAAAATNTTWNRQCAIHPIIHSPLLSNGKVNNNDGDDDDDITSSSFKWRLLISYDGTHFSGWQYQNQSIPTVQRIIENALTRVTKLHREQLLVVGASRTDAGVHASSQVAHFLTPSPHYHLDSLHAALNGFLPPSVRVRQIAAALPLFHARFSAQSKIYHYKIYSDTIIDPFQHKYAFHVAYRLNLIAMRQAAKYFIGAHDFSAFVNVSQGNHYRDPVKTIFRVDVFQFGPLFQVEVEGSGFLYRQVRNMVALLVAIGKEALPPDIVPHILASRDRKELAKYALSVPPHGLCLVAVNYNEDHLKLPADRPSISFGWNSANGSLPTTFCFRFKSEVVSYGVIMLLIISLKIPFRRIYPGERLSKLGNFKLMRCVGGTFICIQQTVHYSACAYRAAHKPAETEVITPESAPLGVNIEPAGSEAALLKEADKLKEVIKRDNVPNSMSAGVAYTERSRRQSPPDRDHYGSLHSSRVKFAIDIMHRPEAAACVFFVLLQLKSTTSLQKK